MCLTSRTWCLVYGVWCVIYGARCPTRGVWCMIAGSVLRQDERAARMGAFSAVMAVKDETASVNVKDAIEVRDLSVLAVPRFAS